MILPDRIDSREGSHHAADRLIACLGELHPFRRDPKPCFPMHLFREGRSASSRRTRLSISSGAGPAAAGSSAAISAKCSSTKGGCCTLRRINRNDSRRHASALALRICVPFSSELPWGMGISVLLGSHDESLTIAWRGRWLGQNKRTLRNASFCSHLFHLTTIGRRKLFR
jgi:hypothetical protein